MAEKPCHTCQHRRLKSTGNFCMWHCALKLIKVAVNDKDWKEGKDLPAKCKSFLPDTPPEKYDNFMD